MAAMGRPRKEIDKAEFENLCSMMCTLEEIEGWYTRKLGGCDKETIRNWIKRTYGKDETFLTISEKFRGVGKMSLRRKQFQLAEKSASMAIFLGKQYLGQKDVVENRLGGADGEPIQVANAVKIYIPDNGRKRATLDEKKE